jgi:hypothetical protein
MKQQMKIIALLRDPVDRLISHYVGQSRRGLTKLTCDEYLRQDIETIDDCLAGRHGTGATANNLSDCEGRDQTADGSFDSHGGGSGVGKVKHGGGNEGVSKVKKGTNRNGRGGVKGNDGIEIKGRALGNIRRSQATATSRGSLAQGVAGATETNDDKVFSGGDRSSSCALEHCSAVLHNLALMRSMYAPQLVRWLKYFPSRQILVVQSEELFANTSSVMQRVARFLDLQPFTPRDTETFSKVRQGSHHSSDRLSQTCDRNRIARYLASTTNVQLKEVVLKKYFAYVMDHWQRWSTDDMVN